ncbi:biotin transporter BioY [Pseudobutyrivibrio sp.]|uniref:biotin transporter BioY n=1 Tax=Pseudobutyrivibrio sp. TaxID=2014367 RepID=UPI001E18EFCC|nr:biotin transporter BioY [Pseudobutyrivibrio sp.]MBE5912170.1 biotin transporter BioY [Pseudobutyrivibrio sp.]
MKITTKELTLTALFAALIVVGAFLKVDIPLPLYTMHFTLQWFFVLLAGFLLGRKLGTLSVVTYIVIGLAGVPVFAAGGGIGYVLRPGFGFLLGFVFAAYLIGLVSDIIKPVTLWQYIIPATIGLVTYYAVGAVYFYLIKNLYVGEAVSFAVVVVQYCLITVLPDFILCVIAAGFAKQLLPIIKKLGNIGVQA